MGFYILFVEIPPTPPTADERCVATFSHEFRSLTGCSTPTGKATIKIETIDVAEKIKDKTNHGRPLSLEGYKIGHELSHAIAFARFFKIEKKETPKIQSQLIQQNWTLKKQDRSSLLTWLNKPSPETKELRAALSLFENIEEARNLLGLGLTDLTTKPRADGAVPSSSSSSSSLSTSPHEEEPIVGEFDFLREVMGLDKGPGELPQCIRMPYDPRKLEEASHNPLVKDIFRKRLRITGNIEVITPEEFVKPTTSEEDESYCRCFPWFWKKS